jgi:hypothetical protein
MKKNFKEIIKSAKTFSLTKDEKDLVMEKITAFIKENPREIGSPYYHHNIWSSVGSPLSPILSTLNKKVSMPIVIAMIILALGGGTSFAANSSLPGDFLYPVKINVNEKLASFVSFGDNADVQVETEQANTRVEETKKLDAKGTLSAKDKTELETNFEEHTTKAKKIVEDMKAKGEVEAADKANVNLEKVLQKHDSVLENIEIKDKTTKENDIPKDKAAEKKDGSIQNNSYMENNTNLNLNTDSGSKVDTSTKVDSSTSVHLGL